MTTTGPGYWCSLCEQLFETREALREHWFLAHRRVEPPETRLGVPRDRAPHGVEGISRPRDPRKTKAA